MKVKVLTLAFDPGAGGFETSELDAFMERHEVIDVRQEFFHHERDPWLMLLLAYRGAEGDTRREGTGPGGKAPRVGRGARGPGGVDAASDLDPDERARYDRLRAWRNARAAQDGVSPFVVLTNAQLAAVARANPASLSSLQQVHGVGQGRIARYGDDLLRVLSLEADDATPEPSAAPTDAVPPREVPDGE